MSWSLRRRAVLSGAAVLVAGCVGSDGPDNSLSEGPGRTVTVDGNFDPDPPQCQVSNRVRMGAQFEDLAYDRSGPFELTASSDTVQRGDELDITLTNTTGEGAVTGNRYKYGIQYEGPDGWDSIYGIEDHAAWTDEGVGIGPGETFEWSFTATTEGFAAENEMNPSYVPCDDIEPGTYRFVYFGVIDTPAIGVEFTIESES